jgi:AcrR family transcriptional regulator
MATGVRSRLTREQARAQTRERLLEAARRLFVERGFHTTTLDEVAEQAGHTKGAVYSAFESKADLFLAIFDERTRSRAAEVASMGGCADSLAELMELGQRHWIRTLREERGWSLLLIEFEVHAAREERLRQRLAEIKGLYRAAVQTALEEVVGRSGETLPLPARQLTIAQLALGNGILLEELSDPNPENVEILEMASTLLGLRPHAPKSSQ